jgi:hypothetical protein
MYGDRSKLGKCGNLCVIDLDTQMCQTRSKLEPTHLRDGSHLFATVAPVYLQSLNSGETRNDPR